MLYDNKLIIEAYDESPLLIMMVGIPGSGKSTIANNIQVNRNGELTNPRIHSSDALREEWYGDANIQGDNEKRIVEMKKRMLADMAKGNDVVYDATNISKRKRVAFLNEIAKSKCNPVCVCVMKPFDVCVRDNEARERVVPYQDMKKMYTTWSPPYYTEGFKQILAVFDYGDERTRSRYSKESLAQLFQKIDAMSQENHHHELTLGHHCREAAAYIKDRRPDDKNLQVAATLHDIGKVFTQTRDEDGECHYRQHHCVGAYDAMFYLNEAKFDKNDQLYISNLIYYHMKPYMTWRQSQKAVNRDLKVMGEKMYKDVLLLHDADEAAHTAHYIEKSMSESIANNLMREEGEIEIER